MMQTKQQTIKNDLRNLTEERKAKIGKQETIREQQINHTEQLIKIQQMMEE